MAHAAHADSVLQTVPTPDTSKLPAATAKQIADQRAAIDKAKTDLIGPPLAQAYADLGAIYARNGFDDAAAIAFYDATQISPEDGRWYYLRGVIARKLKRNDDAKTNFQSALERDKVYLPISYRLADTLIDLNDFAAARKLLDDAVREHPDQAVIHSMLGDLAIKQKRYADAIVNYNQALQRDPEATALYARLADAYAAQGNTKAADEARAKAGAGTPEIADPLVVGIFSNAPPALAGTPLEQARALARAGRIRLAREKIGEILKANPNDIEALALSARIEAAMGNAPIARALADQALKLKPDNAAAHLSSGLAAEYASDDNRAYDEYRQAQRLDPKLADPWLLLGNAEMRRKRYAEAATQYRGLIALHPDDGLAYAPLAAALVAQDKCADAQQELNGALTKYKNNGDLMQVYVRVASTCAAASQAERDVALQYGELIYKQRPDADDSSAYALALAAHGKFKEAQEYQAQAIYEAVRTGDTDTAKLYKSTMQLFDKKQVPDRPWPAEHPYFTTPMLIARPVPAAAPAAKP